jgi:hypothetical protein
MICYFDKECKSWSCGNKVVSCTLQELLKSMLLQYHKYGYKGQLCIPRIPTTIYAERETNQSITRWYCRNIIHLKKLIKPMLI